jgi:hypothetical protein
LLLAVVLRVRVRTRVEVLGEAVPEETREVIVVVMTLKVELAEVALTEAEAEAEPEEEVEEAPLLLALALGEAEAEPEPDALELDWASTIGERKVEMTRPRPKRSRMVLCSIHLCHRGVAMRPLISVDGQRWSAGHEKVNGRRERRVE